MVVREGPIAEKMKMSHVNVCCMCVCVCGGHSSATGGDEKEHKALGERGATWSRSSEEEGRIVDLA